MKTTSFTLKDTLEVLSIPARTTTKQALILVHGRGASAENILRITDNLTIPDTCLVIVPQAPAHTWYPQRFIEPQEKNEPKLSQALTALADICSYVENEYALKPEQITLAGFSQGACLVAEMLKRSPKHYRAAAILSGGLIGSDQEVVTDVMGTFNKMPVYLGCDEEDFHIPKMRVEQTALYLKNHDANVTLTFYKGLGHAIHKDGLDFLQENLI